MKDEKSEECRGVKLIERHARSVKEQGGGKRGRKRRKWGEWKAREAGGGGVRFNDDNREMKVTAAFH